MGTHAVQAATACRNCGTDLAGSYCHECGEPRPDPHEFSWRHAVHDAVHEFTHLDGKIFRTLWYLIAKPGLLTAEYWAGRRKKYIRPLRVYIVIAAIHLIAMSGTFYGVDFFLKADSGGALQHIVNSTAKRINTSPEIVKERLNVKLSKAYSVGQYSAVLVFALFPWAMYRRREPYYVQHLIFSLHVYAFYFVLTSLVSLVLAPDQWRRSPLPLVTAIWIFFAVKRLYGGRWYKIALQAIVLRIGLFFAEAMVLGIALWYAIFAVRLG